MKVHVVDQNQIDILVVMAAVAFQLQPGERAVGRSACQHPLASLHIFAASSQVPFSAPTPTLPFPKIPPLASFITAAISLDP
jgi:hypothetical protein